MNVQNTEARNVFIERSEQGVFAVPVILGCHMGMLHRYPLQAFSRLPARSGAALHAGLRLM